jgi:hypothetical protein
MSMNNLELEAEKYAEACCNGQFPIEYDRTQVVRHTKNDYIAGATSKWVERQKIEFAIEELQKSATYNHYGKMTSIKLADRLKKLHQQLNDL